ncbi:MAG: hypothetical protein F9K22_08755 [Bacteroidetes bacterium]|nr:MAG: hypothetical protein F9K22_08755 [Bacteroidota bacterium]
MRTFLRLSLAAVTVVTLLHPCTTAVVSGKATADGRPLLLKNRDADELQNRLVSIQGLRFRFVGLVNSADSLNEQVWSGYNETGFAIMNSAAYNLKRNDTTALADREGYIMRHALEVCRTLADFESLLTALPKPLGVEANFGVIDANGGAAYFETDNFRFTRYDATDPAIAPNGYLIRTNYSCAGEENKGMGYIRFSTAEKMFRDEFRARRLSARFLVGEVPRSLFHAFTGTDLSRNLPKDEKDTTFAFFRDFIPRYYTSAATVVQGVKPGETPALTTMWTALGFPLTSVVVPVWLLPDGSLPAILTADVSGNAPLSTFALELKKRLFPVQNDAKENYINVALLMNRKKTGLRQKISPVEAKLTAEAERLLASWRSGGISVAAQRTFYSGMDEGLIPRIRTAVARP